MRKMSLVKKLLCLLTIPLVLAACEDKMDEHYKVPDETNNNAWQILEKLGNYTIFLKGVELAGFEPIVNGKNVLTVMAPDDDAFNAYLKKDGKNSIEDYSQQELIKLIGFHLMYYSYNKEKLVNFRPSQGDAATDEEKESMAGLYYKHRTKSYDPKSLERDTSDNFVFVYHQERFLPVFSHKYFETKKINAESNYEYFYPSSKWNGAQGFNVSNSSVKEYEIPTTNGYVYLVDEVLRPLETIYKELMTNENYSTFLELYNQYGYYYKDEELTTEYGNGYDLYLHYHTSPLPNIACEWPISSYSSITSLCYSAYNVFAPSNSAINELFNNFWRKGGYNSLKEVNKLAVQSFLYNCIYSGPIAFPEEIDKGNIENNYGIPIEFNTSEVPQENRIICSNGALYELDQINYPAMFTAITGPAFRDKQYTAWLNVIQGASMLAPLVSENASFTMLIPNNRQLENIGIEIQNDQLMTSSSGDYATMPTSERINYANAHLSTEKTSITTTGKQVIHSNTAFHYWYVKDHKIASSVTFNDILEKNLPYEQMFSDLEEITNNGHPWDNGKVYSYNAQEAFTPMESYPNTIQHQLVITQNSAMSYYGFAKLLRLAGLTEPAKYLIKFLPNTERSLIFIPTNEAIRKAAAESRIPGLGTDGETVTDSLALADYLQCYFIKTSENGISDYLYPGSGIDGAYNTPVNYLLEGQQTPVQLKITDYHTSITVQLINGEEGNPEIPIDMRYDGFPFTYNDGGVQFLTDVL